MKPKIFLFFSLIAFTIAAFSQSSTVHFSYDASGNRSSRWIELTELKQGETDTAIILPKDFEVLQSEKLTEVKVFPNPVNQELYIQSNFMPESGLMATLSDGNGKIVLQVRLVQSSETLQLGNLSPGLYFLKLECQNERRVWKVVKK